MFDTCRPHRMLRCWLVGVLAGCGGLAVGILLLGPHFYIALAGSTAIALAIIMEMSRARFGARDRDRYVAFATLEVPLMLTLINVVAFLILAAFLPSDQLLFVAVVYASSWTLFTGMLSGCLYLLLRPFRPTRTDCGVPCSQCGYRIDNVPGPRCPECGRPFQHVPPWDVLHPGSREERHPPPGVPEGETTRTDP